MLKSKPTAKHRAAGSRKLAPAPLWLAAAQPVPARRVFAQRLAQGVGRALVRGGLLVIAASAPGCGVVTQSQLAGGARLDPQAAWAILPLANHTETVMAGQRAEALLEPLLRARGVRRVLHSPAPASSADAILAEPNQPKAQEQALEWARKNAIRYVITGSVDEWRYKIGADGEPAVGLVLQVTDLSTGEVLWSAAGGKTGWSREALSAVAHKLVAELLRGLPLA
jgi:polysaccharide biosynthesis protein PelC